MQQLLVCNLRTDADDPVLAFTTEWLNALAVHCDQVHVLTLATGRLDLADNVRVVEPVLGEKISPLVQTWRLLHGLRATLRANPVQACFFHMAHRFAIPAAPFLRARGIPMTLWYTHGASSRSLRLSSALVDLVVSASAESFPFPRKNFLPLGHGIDTDRFRPAPRSGPGRPFTVVTIGRLSPVKRLETIIDGTRLIATPSDAVQLRIVGEAPQGQEAYAANLRASSVREGPTADVIFTGPLGRAKVIDELRSADVFVNLSGTNSIDKAVLEAMACGLPVVTSNPAFRPMLARWDDLLWLPENEPALLADRLLKLRSMTGATRERLGLDLRAIVRREHDLTELARTLACDVLPNAREIGRQRSGQPAHRPIRHLNEP